MTGRVHYDRMQKVVQDNTNQGQGGAMPRDTNKGVGAKKRARKRSILRRVAEHYANFPEGHGDPNLRGEKKRVVSFAVDDNTPPRSGQRETTSVHTLLSEDVCVLLGYCGSALTKSKMLTIADAGYSTIGKVVAALREGKFKVSGIGAKTISVISDALRAKGVKGIP